MKRQDSLEVRGETVYPVFPVNLWTCSRSFSKDLQKNLVVPYLFSAAALATEVNVTSESFKLGLLQLRYLA